MSNVSIIAKGPQCRGTQVLVDGVPMKGVYRIELHADARVREGNQLWHAVIHCHPSVIEVAGMDSGEVEFVRGVPASPHVPEPMPDQPPALSPIEALLAKLVENTRRSTWIGPG